MNFRFFSSVTLLLISLVAFSCKTTLVHYPTHPRQVATKPLPPGQAKKVYGHQSARAFAPGQRKKQGTTIIVINNNNDHGNGKGKGKKKK